MKTITRKVLGAALAVASLPILAAPRLEQIPMVWRPTDPVAVPAPPSAPVQTTITVRPLMDRRTNPAIGENREDADEGKVLLVTTRDEIGAWTTDRLKVLLTQGGYRLVNDDDQADLRLSGEVLQFFVTETSTYKAAVSIRITLTQRDGQQVWSGVGSGNKTRFGRSYKAENYYEVLSDAYLGAIQELLAQPSFQSTLAAHAGGH